MGLATVGLAAIMIPSVNGALSQSFGRSLNGQNIHLRRRKPKNNGPFLLKMAILVH